RPRGHGNRQPDVRALRPQPRDDGALAYAGRTGKDRQPGFTGRPSGKRGIAKAMDGRIGRGTEVPALVLGAVRLGQISPPHSFSTAVRGLAPRPRTRRDSAMPSRSMIWRARTLPTPGMASSSAETFILPTVSSDWPCLRTAGSVMPPRFRLFLTSARS